MDMRHRENADRLNLPMVFSKNKSIRRREMRRSLTSTEEGWLRSWLTKPVLWAVLWVYTFTIVASLIALSGQNRQQYKIGQLIEQTIVARVPFDAIDQDGTALLKAKVRDSEPAVYNLNTTYVDRLRESLLSLGRLAGDDKIERLDHIPVETQRTLALHYFDRFLELRRYVLNPATPNWSDRVEQVIAQVSLLPVLNANRARTERMDSSSGILLRHPTVQMGESPAFDAKILDVETDRKVIESQLEQILQPRDAPATTQLPQPVARMIIDIILADRTAMYVYDAAETEKRRNARAEAVAPLQVRVEPDQVLVKAGTELTRLHLTLLDKEQHEYESQLGGTRRWLIRAGSFGLILLIGTGLLVYIAAYNQRILVNPVRGAALVCLLLLSQALAVGLTVLVPQAVHLTATFPVVLATMVLAVVYDRRFALAVGAITGLLVLVSLKLTVGFSIILLTGVTLAACQLSDVKNRSTLVIAGFWTGLSMAIATWLVSFANLSLVADPYNAIFQDSVLAMLGAVVTGLFVQGMLPAIERTFRVTTAMTLKDLNDVSNPLLRRLAGEATGTYQHSLRIADMAQGAADAIGCNGLLCRVGAMYHDIGKINKPEYFVENQGGGPNKHDKLRPAMSLLIIVGHVKDGIEMAKEFKLPKQIIHFIESHHGTTLVEYFYHAARKQSEDQDSPSPAEFEFRYPGPKPQTKEAAILLLCDCVEGAARALPEPTPVRLEQLVNKLMTKRLMDGQFDECQITLQELHKIEQSVVKTLNSIYHGRIAYPKTEAEEQREASREARAASAS